MMAEAFALAALLIAGLIAVVFFRWMLRGLLRGVALNFREERGRILYQPWGRLSSAYLVSAENRDLIIVRAQTIYRAVIYALVLAVMAPLVVLATGFSQTVFDASTFEEVVFFVALAVAIVWWRLRVYPLYASTPTVDRLSASDLDGRAAHVTSWNTLVLNGVISLLCLAYGLYCGFLSISLGESGSNSTAIVMIAIGLLLVVRTVRLALAKRAQTRDGAQA